MTSRDRKAYHAAYYRNNRQARSDYQRAYDAKHKAEKAKRELTYKRLQRYGENRGYVPMKDTEYRINAFLRRWEEEHPGDTEPSAPTQTLEEFTGWLETI